MRRFLPLLLLLPACLQESGLECPPTTNLVGQYSVTFTANHDAGECIAGDAGPDGGPLPLAVEPPFTRGVTLCVGTAGDGGPELQLVSPSKAIKKSDLLPDGGFHFTGPPANEVQTACFCEISLTETIDGYLLTGGAFALQPDGGLPLVTGISGTVVDLVVNAGSATPCRCGFPCTVTYSLAGSTF